MNPILDCSVIHENFTSSLAFSVHGHILIGMHILAAMESSIRTAVGLMSKCKCSRILSIQQQRCHRSSNSIVCSIGSAQVIMCEPELSWLSSLASNCNDSLQSTCYSEVYLLDALSLIFELFSHPARILNPLAFSVHNVLIGITLQKLWQLWSIVGCELLQGHLSVNGAEVNRSWN